MKSIAKLFKTIGGRILSFIKVIIKIIYTIVFSVAKEIYRTISYASYGLFKTFDFFITKIITLFSYIYYAIMFCLKYIGKVIVGINTFIYKYLILTIGKEIYLLGRAIYIGAFKVGKITFYELPLFIVRAFSDYLMKSICIF